MVDSSDEIVVLGRVAGVYGVKGWLKIFSYTNERKDILGYSPWLIASAGSWKSIELEAGKPHGKGIVVKFKGIDDRDIATTMLHRDIAIVRDQLAKLQQGEFYWEDLIGLQVINHRGDSLGSVGSILETGANDVLVVKGEIERLIPFSRPQIVTEINLKEGVITVNWEEDYLVP